MEKYINGNSEFFKAHRGQNFGKSPKLTRDHNFRNDTEGVWGGGRIKIGFTLLQLETFNPWCIRAASVTNLIIPVTDPAIETCFTSRFASLICGFLSVNRPIGELGIFPSPKVYIRGEGALSFTKSRGLCKGESWTSPYILYSSSYFLYVYFFISPMYHMYFFPRISLYFFISPTYFPHFHIFLHKNSFRENVQTDVCCFLGGRLITNFRFIPRVKF